MRGGARALCAVQADDKGTVPNAARVLSNGRSALPAGARQPYVRADWHSSSAFLYEFPLLAFLVLSACVRLRAEGYAARTLQFVWGIDGSLVSFDTDAMMRNGVLELAQFDLVSWHYYNGSHRYHSHGTRTTYTYSYIILVQYIRAPVLSASHPLQLQLHLHLVFRAVASSSQQSAEHTICTCDCRRVLDDWRALQPEAPRRLLHHPDLHPVHAARRALDGLLLAQPRGHRRAHQSRCSPASFYTTRLISLSCSSAAISHCSLLIDPLIIQH